MDQLYKVQKDNIMFYIQPELVEAYANAGYTILKITETPLDSAELEKEIKSISDGGERM